MVAVPRRAIYSHEKYLSTKREAEKRNSKAGLREMVMMRWGFPPAGGGKRPVTNVRNLNSNYWKGWLDDPRFRDDEARGVHGAIISERMSRWCAQWTSDEAFERLGAAKIPCGPVLKPQQTLDHPQVAAMGLLAPTDFPGLPRPAPVAGMPLSLSAGEPRRPVRAPMLGEHTDEILATLGYDGAAVAGLRERGVI